MDNRGRIAVFMSMMTAVFLVLITFVLQVVIMSTAQSKAVIASRLSMSDVKACYNNYIFEHYHILLFDKSADGRGEAYLEQQLQNQFQEKLGTEYEDTQVIFTDFMMIYDESCAALYSQMREHVNYTMIEQGIELGLDTLMKKTGGKDGTLPDSLIEDMEYAELEADDTPVETQDDAQTEMQNNTQNDIHPVTKTEDDPRDYTKKMTNLGLMRLVLPEGTELSQAAVRMDILPSLKAGVVLSEYEDVDRSFGTMKGMKTDLLKLAAWKDGLQGKAVLAAYARDVFNCFTEEKNAGTVLKYEQEYLIVGGPSDAYNLKSVMNQVIGLRFPINYASVCAQPQKMMRLSSIASSICILVPGMIPVVKYLLAGCWAYIEAIADAKILFSGKSLPFEKTSANWITDIDNIEASIEAAAVREDGGLSYEDYLTVLLLLNADAATYRMLDVMQINAQQETPSFRMEHAACGFSADFETHYHDYEYLFRQTTSY